MTGVAVLIVLCDIEGVTRKDVARRLDIPEGTAASRLAAARAMLAKRLARRGVVVSGVLLLGAVLSQQAAWASVPTTVVSCTIKVATPVAAGQAAAWAISPTVAALISGVTKAMFVTKIKSVLAVVLVVLACVGGGIVAVTPKAVGQPPSKEKEDEKKENNAPKKLTPVVEGLVGGKKVQPDAKSIESGADAAAKLLASSNLTDFLNLGQSIDKDVWKEQVVDGIENKRAYVRIQFGGSRKIEGNLNGEKMKYTVTEVVFFDPGENGPVCLWCRDGDKYYFANQIAGHDELAKWLGKVQER